MKNYICKTCGTQFEATEKEPEICPICEDDRQYVNWDGQQWTTMDELAVNHNNVIKEEEPNLYGIGSEPSFAIGQRALLIKSGEGNILWDCISLINDETVKQVNELGGISAIAISHPHYYSSMVEWSRAFGNIPIYIHASDSEWVMRHDDSIVFWEGENFPLFDDITLINCGGHFDGSSVLHWQSGSKGRGVLLTGDTIQVVQDRRYVSFMYSYPNQIPLSKEKVKKIVEAVEPYEFDRIYGAWFRREVCYDAKNAVLRSAERYIKAIT